jgi:hypothetical protein
VCCDPLGPTIPCLCPLSLKARLCLLIRPVLANLKMPWRGFDHEANSWAWECRGGLAKQSVTAKTACRVALLSQSKELEAVIEPACSFLSSSGLWPCLWKSTIYL